MIDAWEEVEATNKPIKGVCNQYIIDAVNYYKENNSQNFKILFKILTSGLIAEYFITQTFNNFIHNDDKLYFYNGVYWELCDKKIQDLQI